MNKTRLTILAGMIVVQWFISVPRVVTSGSTTLAVSRLLLEDSEANCNLIPPGARSFPSTMGSVGSAAVAPGHVVTLRLDACAPASATFDPIPANNTVTITFEPPTDINTTYVLPTLPAGVCKDGCANQGASCSGAGGCSGCTNGCLNTVDECAGTGSSPPCQVLNFAMPDATTLESLDVAGPASITVNTPSGLAADIGPLFRSLNMKDITGGTCPRKPHPFRHFSVVPRLNTFQNLSNGTVRATVDGDNNLLIPFDYRSIYGARGCCTGIGQLIDGHFGFEAFQNGGVPIHLPSNDYVRTYTTDGFDLAPIVKVSASDLFFGTADGNEGIIRIARTAGACAAPGSDTGQSCTLNSDCSSNICNAPPDIFDVTDRLHNNTGPIMLDQVTTNTGDAFPVNSVQSSAGSLALARQGDNHVITWDVTTGTRQDTGIAAAMAGPKPALQVTDNVVAFLQPETQPSGDLDADGDFLDTILRVFKKGGGGSFTEMTAGMTIAADAARVVNGESLTIANGRVYYRRPEAANALESTQRVSVANDGSQAAAGADYFGFAISDDGSKVAFTSDDPNLVSGDSNGQFDVFVRDRTAHTTTRVSVANSGGTQGNNTSIDPAMSGDGRYVAFLSFANNLVSPAPSPAALHLYVRDTVANTTTIVSVNTAGQPANAGSSDPRISTDGRFVSWASLATNLVAEPPTSLQRVFVRDRCVSNGAVVPSCTPQTVRGDVGSGLSSNEYAMSRDGRFVAFESRDTNLVPGGTDGRQHIFVRDLQLGTVALMTAEFPGPAWLFEPALSRDGRFVVFTYGTNQVFVHDRDLDANGIFDEAEPGRTATARVDVAPDGSPVNGGSHFPSISDDGRYVTFDSTSTNLVPNDTNNAVDLFVHDNVTGVTERVNVKAADGSQSTTGDNSIISRISASGREIAYAVTAGDLVSGDTNGAFDVFVGGFAQRTEPFVCGNGMVDPFEECEPPGGTAFCGLCSFTCQCNDLNADGDLNDTMFQLLDTNLVSPSPLTIGTMASNTIAGADADFSAFTNESSQAVIYNAATASSCTFPGTVTRGAASATIGAGTVLESSVGVDLNGDGDMKDTILGVVTAGAVCSPFVPGYTPRGYAADAVATTDLCAGGNNNGRPCTSDAECSAGGGVCSGIVVFARPETEEGSSGNLCGPAIKTCAGGPLFGQPCTADADCPASTCPATACDLNGDGDGNDRVLHIYRQSTGTVTNTGQAVEEFVVKDNLVAFRTSEAAQKKDLNDDHDQLDFVMQVYDLAAPANSALINTGQAAELCHITGCDPNLPYKIKDDTVSFLVSETAQNQDLNGHDGIGQEVMVVFDVHSGPNQVFDLPPATVSVPVFPDKFVGGSVLYTQTTEAQLGYDVNGDGDMDDVVVGVSGDADNDGAFDQFDTCVGVSDPEHPDSDLDGLGDACDPDPYCGDFTPAAPPTPPDSGANACQNAIGKAARTYLTKRAVASRKCLDKIAAGQLSGDPASLCRGRVSGGVDVPPTDPDAAAAIAAAAAKLRDTVSGDCATGSVLALLASCGQTVDDEVRCLTGAYASAAVASTEMAYGSVATIADHNALACQKKVGNAGAKYVAAIVKAMQKCLGKLDAGHLSGDPRTLCLGSLTANNLPSPVNLPTELATAQAIQKAETKLRNAIASKCSTGQLGTLGACGSDPTSAGRCMVCTEWRRASEAVRNGYGPR
jgi:Tol biopolymer transport system component